MQLRDRILDATKRVIRTKKLQNMRLQGTSHYVRRPLTRDVRMKEEI
jgi:hypothetical protein